MNENWQSAGRLDPIEEAIFNAAAELSDSVLRRAFLDQTCANNEALRARLEQLFAAEAQAKEFLANDPLQLSSPPRRSPASSPPAPPATPEEPSGAVIGRYKLLQKIGEGGMGVVYMAEQREPITRKVALKIIKLGMDTRQVVARFEAERQALALMDHPNIARVLDAGATETGRPYFVMELVQGVPITQFCEERQLPARERIELFMLVCQAVQSAHQKGVIHRDLKPSNVLVTLHDGVPVPKVIDFGIAKATNQKLTEKTLFTQYAVMIGTPAYMSPEQAEMSGLDVDTRSDIYSLGVLLYELLTGTPPFPEQRLRSVGYGEMQRIIAQEEPERPSTRLARQLAASEPLRPGLKVQIRQLEGELDWVIMKSLEKDRTRRYATANGLAAELQRHLNQEPVLACPPSARYRFNKWVRRNRAVVSAVSVVAFVLVLAVVISTWQALRATHAEQRAREQALRAAASERRASEQAALSQEQSEIARAVKTFLTEQLLSANPYIDPERDPAKRALVERLANSLEGKFVDQPLTEAEIRLSLGKAFAAMDDHGRASEQLERAFHLRRAQLGLAASDTLETAGEWAESLCRVGQISTGLQLLEEGVQAAQRIPGRPSVGAGWILFRLGEWLALDNRPQEALPYAQQAVEVLEKTADSKDYRTKDALLSLGMVREKLGETDAAAAIYRDAIARSVRDLGQDHPETANLELFDAILSLNSGQPETARQELEHARTVFLQVGTTNYSMTLDVEFWLARTYETAGRWDEAEALFDSLLVRWPRHFPSHTTRWHCRMAGQSFLAHQRVEKARTAYQLLLNSFDAHPPERPWEFEMLLESAARCRGWAAAAQQSAKYWNVSSNSLGTWLNRAWVCRYTGDEENYQRIVSTVLALPTAVASAHDQHVPIEIAALGPMAFSPEQRRHLDEMIQACARALPQQPPQTRAWGYRAIAQMQLRLGRYAECLEALENFSAAQPGSDPYGLFIKAACLHRLGRSRQAHTAFDKARAVVEAQLPGPLNQLGQYEAFLPAWQLYQQVLLHRETEQELAGADSGSHLAPEHPPPVQPLTAH